MTSPTEAVPTEIAPPEPGMEAREVKIPGGTAFLRDPRTLTVRQKRPMQIIVAQLGSTRFQEICTAQAIMPPPSANLDAMQWQEAIDASENALQVLQLTDREFELLFRMTDAAIYGILKSWTLVDDAGEPVPLPRNVDEVGDMDGTLQEILALHTASMQAEYIARHGFDLDAIEDPESPTGASAESSQPSAEASEQPAGSEPAQTPTASTATDA